jgi:hypothetical protein
MPSFRAPIQNIADLRTEFFSISIIPTCGLEHEEKSFAKQLVEVKNDEYSEFVSFRDVAPVKSRG